MDLSTATDRRPVPAARPVVAAGPTTPRNTRRSGGRRTTAAHAVAELRAELDELIAHEPDAAIEITWRVVE